MLIILPMLNRTQYRDKAPYLYNMSVLKAGRELKGMFWGRGVTVFVRRCTIKFA